MFLVPDKDKLASKGYLLLDRSRALRDAAALVSTQLGVEMPWTPLKLLVTEYVHGADAEQMVVIHTFCERQGRCLLGLHPSTALKQDLIQMGPFKGCADNPFS